jgi:MFS family permease
VGEPEKHRYSGTFTDEGVVLIGITVSLSSLGTIIGPLVGGALTQSVSWRWCFYINLPPSGVVVCALALQEIPEQVTKEPIKSRLKDVITKELDLLGFALFAPASIMLLLALTWGGVRYSWSSATIIGLFCGSAATVALFALWEIRRGDRAMVSCRLDWASAFLLPSWTGNNLWLLF